jgi:hypothetical protein
MDQIERREEWHGYRVYTLYKKGVHWGALACRTLSLKREASHGKRPLKKYTEFYLTEAAIERVRNKFTLSHKPCRIILTV